MSVDLGDEESDDESATGPAPRVAIDIGAGVTRDDLTGEGDFEVPTGWRQLRGGQQKPQLDPEATPDPDPPRGSQVEVNDAYPSDLGYSRCSAQATIPFASFKRINMYVL